MKLRTQLVISMVVFGLALLIIAVSVITTNQQVDRLNSQEALANNIELQVSELSYLSNDYLLYNESQQVDRWNSKFSSISDDVSNLSVDTPDQLVLVNDIKENQQRLKDVFNDVVTQAGAENQSQSNAIDKAFIQVSWSRIGVQIQGIVFDASQLSQKLGDEADQQKQINNLLVSALLGIFATFLLTNYLLIYRNTIKSIADLQAGTKIIGAGNLDFTIEEKKGNEFFELTHAFNQMTTQLKAVTASKSDLEKEVIERKRAEIELQQKQEELEVQAEELQAQAEELSANNVDLEKEVIERKRAEIELQQKQEELEVQAEELQAQAEELSTNNSELEKQIKERKHAEMVLQITMQRFYTILSGMYAGILLVSEDDRVEFANQAFCDYFGLKSSPSDLMGLTSSDMFKKIRNAYLYPDEAIARINEIVTRGQPEKANVVAMQGGRTCLRDFIPLSVDGKPYGRLWLHTDITGLKRTEKELLEAKMQAELYLDLMGHDISNMHQIAIGQLELAKDIINTDGKLEAADGGIIDVSLESLWRSAGLIDNVRKLQKIRSDEVKNSEINLNDLLIDITKQYDRQYPEKVIKIDASERSHVVKANELLRDVFTNLIGNAIKHSNGSKVDIWVKLDDVLDNGKKYYKVSIEDDGPGVPDDMKENIFNRLQRGETKARGMGLGLYLVRSLVESYDGKVWVEDRVYGTHTKGSRFVVMLPASED